jgi:hypothetical protein
MAAMKDLNTTQSQCERRRGTLLDRLSARRGCFRLIVTLPLYALKHAVAKR